MNKLPCEECVKTKNHCCKADIPLPPVTAKIMSMRAIELGINAGIHPHPNIDGYMVVFNHDWIEDGNIDLTNKDCALFIDGKCAIYEHRPDICREYGGKYIRCRWEAGEVEPSKIHKATEDDIRYYDEVAKEKGLLSKG